MGTEWSLTMMQLNTAGDTFTIRQLRKGNRALFVFVRILIILNFESSGA